MPWFRAWCRNPPAPDGLGSITYIQAADTERARAYMIRHGAYFSRGDWALYNATQDNGMPSIKIRAADDMLSHYERPCVLAFAHNDVWFLIDGLHQLVIRDLIVVGANLEKVQP